MITSKVTRAPNGTSSIYEGKNGRWHGRVTMGVRDDGKPDRRHVERKTRAEVTRAVRELEKQRDSGRVRKAGRAWTVEQWLTHWLDNIAAHSVRYKTLVGYRTDVTRHLVPGLGAHRIDKLEPEHVEKLYGRMIRSGLAAGTVHHAHRTLRASLSEAVKRKHVALNVAMVAKPPRLDDEEIEPLTIEEARRLLAVASKQRNAARWAVALTLGLRQGEALGLRWPLVDLTARKLRVRHGLQRRTWQHGCGDPHQCGTRYHKTTPCKTGCRRHKLACPTPCPTDCTAHARWCPQRQGGGLVLDDVKSKAGRRTIALPAPLLDLLCAHHEIQAQERITAGSLWEDHEFVFTQPNGRPIDPKADQQAWKDLLEEAGVREARLHDARHTAATMLLVLNVGTRAVMDMMGWSSSSMAARYQHVTNDLRHDIANSLGGLFWDTTETTTETNGVGQDVGHERLR
jgi:integrase